MHAPNNYKICETKWFELQREINNRPMQWEVSTFLFIFEVKQTKKKITNVTQDLNNKTKSSS